jgi:hypothetical protein
MRESSESVPAETPSATKENISHALKCCRQSGKQEDYSTTFQYASLGIFWVDDVYRNETPKKDFLLSCFHGYKGYALWKQGKYTSAVCFLRESQRLRRILHNRSDQLNHRQKEIIERERIVVDNALNDCLKADQSKVQTTTSSKPIKYPRTVHLFNSGGTATTPDDLVLKDLSNFVSILCQKGVGVVIEEKIDGSNLGISQCPQSGDILVQNRSHFISQGDHAQFSRVKEWIADHQDALLPILQGGNRILYGEWVVAKHSIPYQSLPGWFIAFDLYDKETGNFLSRRRFHSALKGSQIPVVPVLHKSWSFQPSEGFSDKRNSLLRKELLSLLESRSCFRNDGGTVEGIVLRVDDPQSMWMDMRYKVVRPDFVRGCQRGHWSSMPIEKQAVDLEFSESYLKSCYPFAEQDYVN